MTLALTLPASWLAIPPMLFVFAVGACVGSFINVLAYRLPRGEGLWTPPSRCPRCETRLTWRENFPIFGWISLRGRCRFCRSPISAQYPLIEAATAIVFLGLFMTWFPGAGAIEIPWSRTSGVPDWARAGVNVTWPTLTIALVLVASLLAMTLIDARTFTIPLILPWAATVVAMVLHPLHALVLGALRRDFDRGLIAAADWSLPIPTGGVLGLAAGGGVGLLLALLMLRIGWIPRSFADFEEWAEEAKKAPKGDAPPLTETVTLRALFARTLLFTGPAVALMVGGFVIGERMGRPMPGMAIGAALGLVIGALLRAAVPVGESAPGSTPAATAKPASTRPAMLGVVADVLPPLVLGGAGWLIGPGQALFGMGVGVVMSVAGRPVKDDGDESAESTPDWLAYPHARREMLKELAFVALPTLFAVCGWWLLSLHPMDPPLWVEALAGSVLGYLVGGAVVWGVRLLASLAFGAEAMGLGDVHLMAAVGAALGWVDPLLAFGLAPLLGLGWTVMVFALRGGRSTALPYGPHLAVATMAVMIARPQIESLLAALSGGMIRLP